MRLEVDRAGRLAASLHAALPGIIHGIVRARGGSALSLDWLDWAIIIGAAAGGAALSGYLRGSAGLRGFLFCYASGAALWLLLCAVGSALPGEQRPFLQEMGQSYLRVALAASAAVCLEVGLRAYHSARGGLSKLFFAWAAFFCAGVVRGNVLLAAAAAGSGAVLLLLGDRR